MKELNIGGKQLKVRATPLALLFYQQEFQTDLISDLMSMQDMAENPAAFEGIKFLQLIWAMAKADRPESFPGFQTWLGAFDSFDFSDRELMTAVIGEATDGFFRGGGGK